SDDESDGDDACVEILLVTPIRSAAVIPSSGNHGGSSAAPAAEGPDTRGMGNGIMVDDVTVPLVGVSLPRPSLGPTSSFRDVFGDVIHTDFFPFSDSPYYAAYPEGGVAGNYEFTREEWDAPYQLTFRVLTKDVFKDPVVCKTVVDQFPTAGEMVRFKALSEDQLTAKMSVLHCIMMSHGGEILDRYRGLLQSHNEYIQSTDSRQVAGLNDKISSFDAAFSKSKAKGKERKKKIKSITKSLDQLNAEATPPEFASFFRGQFQDLVRKFLASDEFSRVQGELLSLVACAGFERGLSIHRTQDEFSVVLKKMAHFHAAEPLYIILQLKPEKLARLANVPALMDARVSPPISKESTVTPVSESLELHANVIPISSAVASEENREWGISHVLDDVTEMNVVGSKRVFSSRTDVVVALSIGEKGDGSLLSYITGEEAAANPSRV
ncbi:hypothetical protein Tco_1454622, partial [Tanacetum coccineum]